jgi:chemotaxis protein MotB
MVRMLATEFGLNTLQITTSGKGEHFPKASNDTPENRALNRRTEIIIAPKIGEILNALSLFE